MSVVGVLCVPIILHFLPLLNLNPAAKPIRDR